MKLMKEFTKIDRQWKGKSPFFMRIIYKGVGQISVDGGGLLHVNISSFLFFQALEVHNLCNPCSSTDDIN